MNAHAVTDSSRDGVATVTLASPTGLEAEFAPGVGMVGCSLRRHGQELLGQRGGLTAYREHGSSFGIPLLHPWANRLGGADYEAAGRSVHVDPQAPLLHMDGNGLAIHGVLAAAPDWEVLECTADASEARLAARLEFGADPRRLAVFPFPHELQVSVALAGDTLTVVTTIHAGGEGPVPMAFGWHPYLAPPNAARADWTVTMGLTQHLEVDDRGIPTGARLVRKAMSDHALGADTFDDGFADAEPGTRCAVSDGTHMIAVDFVAGYHYAQLYAPGDTDVICFEPMTAPTDALRTGEGLTLVPAGEARDATFSLSVTDA